MIDDILAAFAIESAEILDNMESAILALERGDAESINALFRYVHTLKGSAGIVGLGRLESYAHALETRLGNLRSGSSMMGEHSYGALLACRDRCAALLAEGDETGSVKPDAEESLVRLDASLRAPGAEEPLEAAEPAASRGTIAKAPQAAEAAQKTVRVADAKLDTLMNLASELVTVQAQLSQAAEESGDRKFLGIAEAVRRLVSEVRATSMEMRMVRVEGLFGRYSRMVRDLSASLGKDVELAVEGGNTEMDKDAVEALADPLMHLLRNAVDHGIEAPEKRAASGKPRAGRVSLTARHEGGYVAIGVSDDGGGIDWDAVAAKSEEIGQSPPGVAPHRDELARMIFEPGFSTSSSISTISGRGFGLDVVRTAVEKMGGDISVDSEKGTGTEFSLRIPLTIAIIDGFLAMSGDRAFIVPLANVAECFERQTPAIPESLIERSGVFMPAISIRERFDVKADSVPSGREAVLVVSTSGGRLALVFDRLVGGYQTVIKPLGELTRYARGISAAAILADGTIAIILDVPGLAKSIKSA